VQPALVSDFEIASPLGDSVSAFAEAMFAGRSGIKNLNGLYGDDFPILAAGLIESLKGKREPNAVAQKILRRLLGRHPGLKVDGLIYFIPQEDEFSRRDPPVSTDAQAELMQRAVLELTGFMIPRQEVLGIHEACVSGLSGLSLAAQRIRKGIWQNALVIGVDLRCSPLDLMRFHALGALSTHEANAASCPFSKERNGFVRSQGGGAFLIQSHAHEAWGEILGYGQASDSWRLTEGRADGQGAISAMKKALKMSGLQAAQIDAFSAHATSTIAGDVLEVRAIKEIWQEAVPPVTALKSQIGHAGQAAGLLQVASALIMLKEQCLAPTINYRTPDPKCDLDFVANRSRPARLKNIFCNATAFGGQNAALIVGARC
jgi:3-oxoacyl-(acyl-carrier-protein) synthase